MFRLLTFVQFVLNLASIEVLNQGSCHLLVPGELFRIVFITDISQTFISRISVIGTE